MSPADIRPVSAGDIVWLIETAGPTFAGEATKKAKASKGGDASRSAQAFKKAAQVKRGGGSYDDFKAALADDPDTAEWLQEKGLPVGERELRRTWENAGQAVEGEVLLTEHHVALAFKKRHLDELRFCHNSGAWFLWTGTHWRQDHKHRAFSFARNVVADHNREAEFKTQAITGKASFAGGVERFARTDPDLAVLAEEWDQDPWLLATPGGTVDLRTGVLRPAVPAEMITRTTAVAPAADGNPEVWRAFLHQATGGDVELIGFLKRWCGYCLTGLTREHALMFIYGPGGNGKSVFLNTVASILGAYHATAAMDTFTDSGGGRHLAFLAMLAGARMVTAAETEEGRPWAETRIKEMTGGTPVTANFMRQDPFTFTPQFKITITGNHKPVLRNVDDAARRRFNIVPFLHKPAEPDRELEDKLRQEWPAILRWMIDGALSWRTDGMPKPKIVAEATDEYFAAQDAFGMWLAERCITAPNLQERPSALLNDYNAWAETNGEESANRSRFRGWAEKQPGLKYKRVKGCDYLAGIGRRPPEGAKGAQGGA
jgi:putative DNA primase/helicase